ncbi:unnamed protein product [Lathyrus sativus]|nr:unnamed protein product [Lathyrus sativus]
MHIMEKLKGKKGHFVIKVDMSKVYDKLSWEFIWRVLQVNFLKNLINLILRAVSSVETNVNWKGARSSYFRPQCGIRQGDPISLCSFHGNFSHRIEHKVRNKNWNTMKLGEKGSRISHLMFVVNLLLFGQATEKQMECLTRTLNKFYNTPGHDISQEKMTLIFSKNVARSMQNKLAHMSVFRIANKLGKYLGIPLRGKNLKKIDFQYLVDQRDAKLTSWKISSLSFTGRITLAKSVIEAIPLYSMMIEKISKAIIQEITCLQRNFIWGYTIAHRKLRAIG